MERKELGKVGRAARVPRDEGGKGPLAKYGDHVPHPVRVLRVLIEDLEEPWIEAGVEDSGAGVVVEHTLVPEHVDHIAGERRGEWRGRRLRIHAADSCRGPESVVCRLDPVRSPP